MRHIDIMVCSDCLFRIANGDDAAGTALDTDPDAARAELEVGADDDREEELSAYLRGVAAREQWGQQGYALTTGHAVDWPEGHPGPHPGGLDAPGPLPRGASAADARKLAGDLRALADCSWATGDGAESSAFTRWGDCAADYADALTTWAADTDANDNDDGGFSRSACDCCDDGQAGNRYRACAYRGP